MLCVGKPGGCLAKDHSRSYCLSLKPREVGLLFLRFYMIGDIRFLIAPTPCQATVSSPMEDRGSRGWAWTQRHVVVLSSELPNSSCFPSSLPPPLTTCLLLPSSPHSALWLWLGAQNEVCSCFVISSIGEKVRWKTALVTCRDDSVLLEWTHQQVVAA